MFGIASQAYSTEGFPRDIHMGHLGETQKTLKRIHLVWPSITEGGPRGIYPMLHEKGASLLLLKPEYIILCIKPQDEEKKCKL